MLTRLPTGTGGLMCDSRSIPTVGSRGCAYTARWYRIHGSSMEPWTCWPRKTVAGWSYSDAFYASPANIILPGRARNMGEGWENARRHGGGNDFAVFALAAAGRPRNVEIDTSYYVGNAPGWVRLSAIDARSADIDDDSMDRTDASDRGATRHPAPLRAGRRRRRHILRLDVYPDGGLSRLRLFGDLDEQALADARRTWWDALPPGHQALIGDQAPLVRPQPARSTEC